jgi:hypothetical protein
MASRRFVVTFMTAAITQILGAAIARRRYERATKYGSRARNTT